MSQLSRQNWDEVFGIFVAFSLLYLATLSQNLSITHDSISYLHAITSLEVLYHANHLFYEPFGKFLTWLGSPWFNEQQSLGISSALAGGLIMQLIYSMLRRDFHLGRYLSLSTIGVIGFSYAIWYYSVAIEIYIYPTALLVICMKLLISKNAGMSTIITCALLHSAAVLLHQSSVLFGLVPITAVILTQYNYLTKIKLALTYIAICAIIVGGCYLTIAYSLGKLENFEKLITWGAGNGAYSDPWNGLSINNLLLAIVGLARALTGFTFLFAIPELQPTLTSLFPSNSTSDEIFLMRDLSTSHAIFLLFSSLSLAIILVVLALVSASQLIRKKSPHQLTLFFVWLVPTVLFFLFFDSSNVDFWINVFLLCIMLMSIGIAQASPKFTHLFALAAVLVLTINYFGTVGPTSTKENDYYRQAISHYGDTLDENDTLVIADDWPISEHLDYYARFKSFSISRQHTSGRSVSEVASQLREILLDGSVIYVHEDVLELPLVSLYELGEEYAVYLDKLSDQFCLDTKVTSDQFPDLVKLSCVKLALTGEYLQ